MTQKDFDWLNLPTEQAAMCLLGCELISSIDNKLVKGRIVEVEAYDQDDEASHTHRGRTLRNNSMFLSAGHLYVYFTYGMHHCINIVCGQADYGSGVLVRAIEPLSGLEVIEERRGLSGIKVTNGPGKLAQALGINLELNGHYLSEPPVQLVKTPSLPIKNIVTSKRIGISRATDKLRRYYIAGNPYISKK